MSKRTCYSEYLTIELWTIHDMHISTWLDFYRARKCSRQFPFTSIIFSLVTILSRQFWVKWSGQTCKNIKRVNWLFEIVFFLEMCPKKHFTKIFQQILGQMAQYSFSGSASLGESECFCSGAYYYWQCSCCFWDFSLHEKQEKRETRVHGSKDEHGQGLW